MIIKHVVQYDDGERHVHDLAELIQMGSDYKLLGRPVSRVRRLRRQCTFRASRPTRYPPLPGWPPLRGTRARTRTRSDILAFKSRAGGSGHQPRARQTSAGQAAREEADNGGEERSVEGRRVGVVRSRSEARASGRRRVASIADQTVAAGRPRVTGATTLATCSTTCTWSKAAAGGGGACVGEMARELPRQLRHQATTNKSPVPGLRGNGASQMVQNSQMVPPLGLHDLPNTTGLHHLIRRGFITS